MGTSDAYDPRTLGLPDHDFSWTLDELKKDTEASVEKILTKASNLGLLTKTGVNNFWLHPAIHLKLRSYFESYYSNASKSSRAKRAFAESIGVFEIVFTLAYGKGAREKAIEALFKEEDNLHHSLHLGHDHGWPQAEIGALHGLSTLLLHQGRTGQWTSVLESVWADFVHDDLRPVTGTEKWWSYIVDHKLRLAMGAGEVSVAEPIARMLLEHERKETAHIDHVGTGLSSGDQKKLQFLAIATGRLADILRDKGDRESIALNEKAIAIYQVIDDRMDIAIRFLNLGHTYKNLPHLEDLDVAADYYTKAFDAYPEKDILSRAQCLGQLAAVFLKRVENDRRPNATDSLAPYYLNRAIEYYKRASEMLPEDAYMDLGIVHNQLGAAYRFSRDELDRALYHFRQACKQFALVERVADCASSRANAALVLAMMLRPEEAVAAAAEALEEFRSVGFSGFVVNQLQDIIRDNGQI